MGSRKRLSLVQVKIGTNSTPSCLLQNAEIFTQVILSMQKKHEQSGGFCKEELPQPALYQRNRLHLMGYSARNKMLSSQCPCNSGPVLL